MNGGVLFLNMEWLVFVLMVDGQTEGVSSQQWFGLDPWEFIGPTNCWVERENKRVYLEGIYKTSAGRVVALDWNNLQ